MPTRHIQVVNHLGDADTTGAIAAQLAGAFYGAAAIDAAWRRDLHRWDQREIELRAIALYIARPRDAAQPSASTAVQPTVCETV